MRAASVLLWLYCVFNVVYSYNYLVYNPIVGNSHTNYMSKIADALTEAGHNVTVFMPIADRDFGGRTNLKSTKHLIQVPVKDSTYAQFRNLIDSMNDDVWNKELGIEALTQMVFDFPRVLASICKDVISNEDNLEELKKFHFDVGLAEPMVSCGFGLFEQLNIPASIATVSSPPFDHMNQAVGQPAAYSYVPGGMTTFSDRMTLFERLLNVIQTKLGNQMFWRTFDLEQKHFQDVLNQLFSPMESLTKVSYQVINTNPILDFSFPTNQKSIQIGGIVVGVGKTPKLDKKWDDLLNKREKTVLVSFGSVAKSVMMPTSYRDTLLKVFASMPDVTFIWKYENDTTIADHLPNVVLSKWTPQTSLLADPRLTFFLTHGGLGSTTELAYSGKPAIMIPLFGDQSRNAFMLDRHGGAIILNKFDLANEKAIRSAFGQILNDSRYAKNAKRLSEMLHNQAITPSENLVKHAEFAAKFGRLPQLDPYGRQLSFIEYFFIDWLIIISCLVVISTFITYKILSSVIRRVKQKTD